VEPAGVARGSLFNIDVRRFNDGSSVAVPLLQRPEDMDALEVPEVMGGLYGKRINRYLEMKELYEQSSNLKRCITMELVICRSYGCGRGDLER
jgi:hypothetical protein